MPPTLSCLEPMLEIIFLKFLQYCRYITLDIKMRSSQEQFQFCEDKMSKGAKLGEYGWCSNTGICFLATNCFSKSVAWEGALSSVKFTCLSNDLSVFDKCVAINIQKHERRLLNWLLFWRNKFLIDTSLFAHCWDLSVLFWYRLHVQICGQNQCHNFFLHVQFFCYLLNSQLPIIFHHSYHFFLIWISWWSCHMVVSFIIYNVFLFAL